MQSVTGKQKVLDNGWSDDIEQVLESIRHNASVMSNHHKKNYTYYSNQLKYYKIPVIIISGINSVTAVGLQPYMAQPHISVTNCLMALLVGIIGSIELFLGISAGSESELKASKEFYLLSIDIYMTLTLDRERRPPAKTYLDHKYSEYADLFRGSALINNKKVIDKLTDVKAIRNRRGSVIADDFPENDADPPDFRSRLFSAFSTSPTDLENIVVNDVSRIGSKVINDISKDLENRGVSIEINTSSTDDIEAELDSILGV
jgi:hypothetical protein